MNYENLTDIELMKLKESLSTEISALDNKQNALKTLMNSLN